MHNRGDTQKASADGWPTPPRLPALDLLADQLRRRIVWALAHEPRTPTALAHVLQASQPLISKHLRLLRTAGLVTSHRDAHDRRARAYDIRREPFNRLASWIDDIERNWTRRHRGPADPAYYKNPTPLNPNSTRRGTPRKRIPRALREPWEH